VVPTVAAADVEAVVAVSSLDPPQAASASAAPAIARRLRRLMIICSIRMVGTVRTQGEGPVRTGWQPHNTLR
jgi:hypothetical protein